MNTYSIHYCLHSFNLKHFLFSLPSLHEAVRQYARGFTSLRKFCSEISRNFANEPQLVSLLLLDCQYRLHKESDKRTKILKELN